MHYNISNLLLRLLTLCGKFVFILFFAKFFSVYEMGLYGVFTASISYSLFIVGIDYYTFTTREILSNKKPSHAIIIKDQLVFYLYCYIVSLPPLLALFIYNILPWNLLFWFYIILVTEHLSQETYRILVSLQYSFRANFILFVRTSLWVYVLFITMWYAPGAINLTKVWLFWLSGSALSVLIAIYTLRNLDWKSAFSTQTDWLWIKKGIRIALPLFVGTLALRGIFSFDRFIIDYFCGKDYVGVYTFYGSLANALMSFIDAGVVTIYYPKLIIASNSNNNIEYIKVRNLMYFSIIAITSMFLVVSYFSLGYILSLINKTAYINNSNLFWMLVAINFIYSLSYVPHFELYAKGADNLLTFIAILCLCLFISLSLYLVPALGLRGMLYTLIITVSAILLSKTYCSIRLLQKEKSYAKTF